MSVAGPPSQGDEPGDSIVERDHEIPVQLAVLFLWLDRLASELGFVVVSFTRDAPIETSAFETALELLWVGSVTFFGIGALILNGQHE